MCHTYSPSCTFFTIDAEVEEDKKLDGRHAVEEAMSAL